MGNLKLSKEEIQILLKEERRMDTMAQAMTEEERLHIMDMGFYNDSLRGYLIEAMKTAGFSREEIVKALFGLHSVLDDTTAAEAAEAYQKF